MLPLSQKSGTTNEVYHRGLSHKNHRMLGDMSPAYLVKTDGDDDDGSTSSVNNDTRMLESTKNILGVDKRGNQRALFLYDGG